MKKYFTNFKLYICLILIIISSLIPFKVFAVGSDFYSSNDILFYDQNDTGCTGISSTGSITLQRSDSLQQIFQLLINGGMNAAQASAVMGNMYQESGFNSDSHEAGNDIGYGLVQWSFGRRIELENFAKQKNIAPSDVPTQIEFLFKEYNTSYKSRLDKTAFSAGTDIAASTKAWMDIFETPLAQPANDPARLNSKRIPSAIIIYGFYSYLTPNSNIVSDGCNNSLNGAVAGNIISTALNFALKTPATDGMTAITDATISYQTAITQYNPSSGITDCGGFIATVMIASGVDVNYEKIGVSNQYEYVKNNPTKYQIINNPTVSDLQPGDILLTVNIKTGTSTEHTTMYTGQSPYPDVDASLGGRVPSVRDSSSHVWMINNGAVIVRVLK